MKYLIIVLIWALPAISHALDFSTSTGKLYQGCKLIEGKTSFTLNDEELFLAGLSWLWYPLFQSSGRGNLWCTAHALPILSTLWIH